MQESIVTQGFPDKGAIGILINKDFNQDKRSPNRDSIIDIDPVTNDNREGRCVLSIHTLMISNY